ERGLRERRGRGSVRPPAGAGPLDKQTHLERRAVILCTTMSRPARFHYAWIVAVVTFLTLLATAGIRAMPAVLILPLEQEFGWNRATVSVAVSINLLVYGLIGPFAASLMDRFGLRRVIMLALTADALAVGGLLFMRSLWQLYLLWGVLVAVATGSTAIVLAATVANRWFFARRGLVMGGLTSANAMGQILFLPLLAYIAVSAGWRPVVMVTAAVAMLILPVSLAFMRDSPESIGLQPYGAPAESAASSLPPGEAAPPKLSALASRRLGVRRGDFWLLAGSFFVCGASTFGLISTHFIPASVEHGVPEVTAASLLAVMGTLNIAGTMASGWLTDRYDNRWLLCGYYLMRGI